MRIAVAGAGIIGLATAAELARRGHDVTAFDPAPAGGASRAAAGMLAPVTEFAWGQETLQPLLAHAASRYPAFVAALEQRTGLPTGYRRTATLALGVDATDRATLAELAARHDGAVRRITGSQARELEPALAPAVTGGVLVSGDHQVDPRRVTAALLAELDARVRRESVVAVEQDAGTGRATGVRLASGERVPADAVLVAAGLDTARIAGVPLPVRPVWGDILRLRVPDRLRPLLTHTVRALVRGAAVYLVPREDGELVLGATVREGGVEGVQAGGVLALLRDAERILPGIAECEVTEVLARARPGSPDAVPLLGRVAPGLVIATGFDRHGVLLTPLAAEIGAELIEGQDGDPALAATLDPFRFLVRAEDAGGSPTRADAGDRAHAGAASRTRTDAGDSARAHAGDPVRVRAASPTRTDAASATRADAGDPTPADAGGPAPARAASPTYGDAGSPRRAADGGPAFADDRGVARAGAESRTPADAGGPTRVDAGDLARSDTADLTRTDAASPTLTAAGGDPARGDTADQTGTDAGDPTRADVGDPTPADAGDPARADPRTAVPPETPVAG